VGSKALLDRNAEGIIKNPCSGSNPRFVTIAATKATCTAVEIKRMLRAASKEPEIPTPEACELREARQDDLRA
jgi:hypothetical protein